MQEKLSLKERIFVAVRQDKVDASVASELLYLLGKDPDANLTEEQIYLCVKRQDQNYPIEVSYSMLPQMVKNPHFEYLKVN